MSILRINIYPIRKLMVASTIFLAATVHAAFPGGNGQIVFNDSSDLWVMNPDGTNPIQLTQTGDNGHANYAPDGSRIAYVCAARTAICLMNPDGSGSGTLLGGLTNAEWVDWHPDGTDLTVLLERDIWSFKSDGSGLTQLTFTGDIYAASLSPDGSRFAFQNNAGVGVMDATGSNPQILVPGAGSPDWSPDGTMLVMNLGAFGDRDIWVVNVSGAGLKNITNSGTIFKRDAKWSPDGTRILININGTLQTVKTDGTDPVFLYDSPNNPIWGDWQPLPMGTAFTYQGQLAMAGENVTGHCDFIFNLLDSPEGGTVVGPQVFVDDVVVKDGIFSVQLDFGDVFADAARFLKIAVRCPTGEGNYTGLEPFQRITAAPNSHYANRAGTAERLAGEMVITTLTGTPASEDCELESQAGLMRFDTTNNVFYICSGESGWFQVNTP